MEWVDNLNSILALITALCGLIGTGISTFFAVKNFILALKEKSKNELWTMIMNMADAAMKEAEKTGKSGQDKKKMVIDIVKAGCNAAGLNIENFLDQLNEYIDATIQFVNDINGK